MSWEADIAVDERLARRLLARFPSLRLSSVEPLSEGWDRSVWLVDRTWVFGFPRRRVAVPGIEREIAVLPALAPLLPLPIPVPELVGEPSDGFPWPFWGSRHLPGIELCDAEPAGRARLEIAVALARFLRRLHAPHVETALAPYGLPSDGNRRADMADRVPKTRAALAEVAQAGLWSPPAGVGELLDEAERLPPSTRLSVVHGDLHVRHLLVDGGRAAAVIDWVDVCRTDPAVDLQLYWSYLTPGERPAFLAAYGPVSDDQLVRARIVALSLCAHLALYGHDRGLPVLERSAVDGLALAAAFARP